MSRGFQHQAEATYTSVMLVMKIVFLTVQKHLFVRKRLPELSRSQFRVFFFTFLVLEFGGGEMSLGVFVSVLVFCCCFCLVGFVVFGVLGFFWVVCVFLN